MRQASANTSSPRVLVFRTLWAWPFGTHEFVGEVKDRIAFTIWDAEPGGLRAESLRPFAVLAIDLKSHESTPGARRPVSGERRTF
jgi:hypothetical protein